MYLKLVVTLCLVFVIFESVIGAPHRSIKTEEDFEKSFIEFLHQDKELAPLLEKGDFKNFAPLNRHVRQTEVESEEGFPEVDGNEPPRKDGFFDRAAKFVMEVLQRFLKWVNSDN